MLLALCHSRNTGWKQVKEFEDVSELRNEGNLLWGEADVRHLDHGDVELIATEFDLHPLAVEDAIHTRQRPKIDIYENHLFVVMHQLDEIDGQLEAVQIGCFVGDGYMLSLHAGASRLIEEAKERWADLEMDGHSSFLLHTLLDVVVDDYQRIVDALEDEVEQLEEVALETPGAPIERQLYSVKQRIARLRRYVVPETRALERTTGNGRSPFAEDARDHFRDVHDHLLRLGDQVRSADDLSDAVLDLIRSAQAANLNENSRRLSAWAAIFAVQTVIAGIYGMNFQLLPEENSLAGFWFALGLMATSGVGLYAYFKSKGWL
ncbi:MAG: magnesium transporter CorA family protein [Actinomycetota bacterium]